jgi:hypothetical protein
MAALGSGPDVQPVTDMIVELLAERGLELTEETPSASARLTAACAMGHAEARGVSSFRGAVR